MRDYTINFEEEFSGKDTFQLAKMWTWICNKNSIDFWEGLKNPHIETGDIEIKVSEIQYLNKSDVPPFTIEDQTDGGEDLRMKYRYLDLESSFKNIS